LKPKLLVVELWGLGDLIIATPFLRAASERFNVTLLAKPFARDLQIRFWPEIQIHAFTAPWTSFKRKYRLWSWPWRQIAGLRQLRRAGFDFGLSARWDPRDHLLLFGARARVRLGFPRLGSGIFLSHNLTRPSPASHRYEGWQGMAEALGFRLPAREQLPSVAVGGRRQILIHTGAGQPVRVWPLPRYRNLVQRLRARGHVVQLACDSDQLRWWQESGEENLVCPLTVTRLLEVIDQAGLFIGNDSGPGHVAAACGVPTFTIFGPQLPEWFVPIHPAAEWIEGKACPYKPCSDYCRYPVAHCLENSTEEEVCGKVQAFVDRTLVERAAPISAGVTGS